MGFGGEVNHGVAASDGFMNSSRIAYIAFNKFKMGFIETVQILDITGISQQIKNSDMPIGPLTLNIMYKIRADKSRSASHKNPHTIDSITGKAAWWYYSCVSSDVTRKPVRKAVIAAAGFGTRFLPQTKAMPKEMLPVVDKPIIQYIVEELAEAGIEDIVIITGYHKRSIEDHFDQLSADLRLNLANAGKTELLEQTERISNLANFIYIRQKGPYGNATPLLNAEHILSDEPFIYCWGDDFVFSKPSRFTQLIDAHEKHGGSILTCVTKDDPDDYDKYGYIAGEKIADKLVKVDTVVEKPGKDAAPSSLATVSSYLFEPVIFDFLKSARTTLKDNAEFIFQPSIQKMATEGHPVYGLEIDGTFYDTGNKIEYLKTVVDFAMMHEDIKDEFNEFLKGKVNGA